MTTKAKHPPTVIAIDGTAASGKGTLARKIADHLKFAYLDTGLLYRATAFTVLNKSSFNGKINENLAVKAAKSFLPETMNNPELREELVGHLSSRLGAMKRVRQALIKRQRDFANRPPTDSKGVVMDGRDIGTVVFPDADLKLFMTASAEERAQRRYKELIERGDAVNYEDIYNNVVERDLIDTTRKDSPLVKAKDAIEIDNSQLTLDGQFHTILQLVKDKLAGRS
ncbi:MAG TPA: (d)CMP kinase [Flavobacteriaceae bacterium]|nr:(d)CMP kinase [Flavobacteriaceae bacterium]